MINHLKNYSTNILLIIYLSRYPKTNIFPNQPWPFCFNQKTIKKNNQICLSLSYHFATSNHKSDEYVKQVNGKDQDNCLISENKQSALKFLSRLKEYSNYLASQTNEGQRSFLKKNQMNKVAKEINNYFKQAGVSAKQISEGIKNIALRLEKMMKENQKLQRKYKEEKDSNKEQKYKNWSEQFMQVLKRLNQQFFQELPLRKMPPIQVALFLLDLQTKLTSMVQLLYGEIQQTSPYFKFTSDITSHDLFNKNFKYAWDKVKIIELDPVTQSRYDLVYRFLEKSIIMVTHAVVAQHILMKPKNEYFGKIIFGLSFPMSLINLQKAYLKCYRLWRKPKIDMVKNLLDLPEKGYLQHAKKFIYPSIKSNFFLYNDTVLSSQKLADPSKVTGQQNYHNIFKKTQNSRRILFLSNKNLHWRSSQPAQKYILFNIKQKNGQNKQQTKDMTENIIIHIHGGGFISMSSQLMQNHTRKWANQLNVPVFSLDYRKPPKHRFPQPLEDCVASYKFIVEKIHQHINISPKNIILAGDSAGGNLACALQAQLMKQKYPIIPKALFLMYPAVDLRIRYSSSRLHSFSDGIFIPSLLMLCQQEYLGKDPQNQFDPLASPILLTESYINPSKKGTNQSQKWPQAWPKTVILVGKKDPLFDDSIRLLERLTKDGLDCKMLLYKDFSHGFMSLDKVLPGCKQAINDSISQLRQIIRSFKKDKNLEQK